MPDWFSQNGIQTVQPAAAPAPDWFAQNGIATVPTVQAAQPGILSRAARALTQEIADESNRAANLVIGAGKKLADEGIRGGALLRKIPGVNALDRVMTPIPVNTVPSNTTQQVGGALEQLGEVVAPSKAITALGRKAAETLAPKIASTVGTKAATLIPRVAVEAAGGAGLASAQGGDPTFGAVVGGAIPVVGSLGGAVADKLQTSAGKQVMQALGATKERYKTMSARLVPEILKRGIRGNREAIAEQAAKAAETAGEQIDEALQQFGSRQTGTAPVIDALEHAKDAFRVVTDAPTTAAGDAPAFFTGKTNAKPDEIWFKALADARRQGYKGTVGELRAVFNDHLDSARSLVDETRGVAEDYAPTALLKDIRKHGGLQPFEKQTWNGRQGVKRPVGELQGIGEALAASSTRGQRGGASIFRNDGLSLDGMLEALRQNPKWHFLESTNDLLDSLDEISRTASDVGYRVPDLEEALKRSGVEPGAKWWEPSGPRTVEIEPRSLRQLDGLQNVIKELGDHASVDHLVAVRRAWDTVVAQAGGYAHRAPGAIGVPLADTTEAWAKREGAGAIRKLLDDEVPELTTLNKEFHFWKSLDEVVTQTMKRTQPHGASLSGTIKEAGGQAVGAAMTGGTVGKAFALGKLSKMANAVFTSPRYRLASAQAKDALANAIMAGRTDQIATALMRITAVQGSKVPALAGGQ